MGAHSSRKKLVIGQGKADEKSNEIAAAPGLLHIPCTKGCIVATDAAGRQKKIVRKIARKLFELLKAAAQRSRKNAWN